MRQLTGSEQAARQRVESSFDDRYSSPVAHRATLLLRVLTWSRRVGATPEDVRTVAASLGIDDQETRDFLGAQLHRFVSQDTVSIV